MEDAHFQTSFLIEDFLAFAGWFSLAELPRGLLNVDFRII